MSNHDEDNLVTDECPKFNPPLYIQRYRMVSSLIQKEKTTITKVADFGCAEGRFIRHLKAIPFLEEISAVDIERSNLLECDYVAKPLVWDHTFGRFVSLTINLYQGDVSKPDYRLKGYDVVTCIELIEHLHPPTLESLPHNIFGYVRPQLVIITTPNKEFNVLFTTLKDTDFRHWDHKFEFTRAQFENWCHEVCTRYPQYIYEVTGVGEPPIGKEHVGFCSQIGIFRRVTAMPDEESSDENYKLVESYFYPERDKNRKEEQFKQIDWESIIKNDK